MAFINLDGKIIESDTPVLQADNRAFRYGYGLFETMLVRAGVIQLKEYHWARLWEGLNKLNFISPKLFTPALLEEEVLRTVRKNTLEPLCRVRLQVFPGNGGMYDGDPFTTAYLIECFPLNENVLALNENGLSVGIASNIFKSNDSLASLKTSNALIYALAARQAKENKWNDALVLNHQGNIIESTIANIFWVKEGNIYTPPLSEGCVAGVMRAFLMGKLAEKGIQVWQEPFTADALGQAEEIFLTNAIRRIKWVKTLGNTSYSNEKTRFISSIIF